MCLKDIRYAVRGFRRNPGFPLLVIWTIALGLGLNTTVFTIFNAYVLRPVTVTDPYSLYTFFWTNKTGAGHKFTWPQFEDFWNENPAFLEVAAVDEIQTRVERQPVFGELVTGNYFNMLGIRAMMGRMLLPGDVTAPGGEPVMVLSYSAWKNKLGA